MKINQISIIAVGLALGQIAIASAAPMTRHTMGSTSNLSSQDKTYLDQAAQTNLGEIKILSLIQKKAQWPASRQLAARYAKDHMTAERKLQMVAASFNYKLPTDVSLAQKASTLYLSMQPKSHFDKQYRSDMIGGHNQAITDARQEISRGSNPRIKAYAANMLPDLRMHLAMAKSLPTGSTMKQASK
jgi:putative membrane protein